MKNFIKGFRFTPSNYPAEVEAKIQKYRKQGYKLPPRKVLRTPEQLEGIRESAKINTALLDYISENIREGMSTEEIDVMVYDFTTKHGAIPAPLNYEGFPKSVCTSINDVVCHGIPSKTEILQSGDIINVDVSTIYKGYFSDASRMFMIGDVSPEMRKLVQVTKECMEIGIAALSDRLLMIMQSVALETSTKAPLFSIALPCASTASSGPKMVNSAFLSTAFTWRATSMSSKILVSTQ